jgi:hypothetical protein
MKRDSKQVLIILLAVLVGLCLAMIVLTQAQSGVAYAIEQGTLTPSPTASLSLAPPALDLEAITPVPPAVEIPETEYNIPPGTILIEGDIVVPEDYYEITEMLGPSSVYTYQFDLWTDGVVPYEWDANVIAANRTAMEVAMQDWEDVANVNFRLKVAGDANYVHISSDTGNWSQVGMQGGRQDIGIFNWNFEYIMAHELGHTLGFWHEQSRPSRDDYVTIVTECVQPGFGHNFNLSANAGEFGPYDFDSVMHYSNDAFLRTPTPGSGCTRTIALKTPDATNDAMMGQRDHFSTIDQLTMSYLYPEDDWVFVDMFYGGTGYGTFWYPYSSFETGLLVCSEGGTIIIQPGYYYNVGGVYATPMTWVAPLGNVSLFGP